MADQEDKAKGTTITQIESKLPAPMKKQFEEFRAQCKAAGIENVDTKPVFILVQELEAFKNRGVRS